MATAKTNPLKPPEDLPPGPSSLALLLDIRDLLQWQVRLAARSIPDQVERVQMRLHGSALQTQLHDLAELARDAEALCR